MGSFFESVFTALFKFTPRAFARGELILAPVLSGWLLLAGAGVAVAVVWYATRQLRFVTARDRLVIGGLRGALFLLLGLCLLRPSLVSSDALPRRNVVAVLLDDSRSMRLRDVDGDSRLATMQHAFADTSAVVRALADRFSLRTFRFGADLHPVPHVDSMQAIGTRTDLARALNGVRETLGDLPVSGIVLVSDGADNADGDLDAALLAVRARGVPIFTVGVGTAAFARDLSVERLALPASTLEGAGVSGEVTVRVTGNVGDSLTLGVEADGQVVGSERVAIPRGQSTIPVPFRVPPLPPGAHRVLVRLSPVADEVITENNSAEAMVQVRAAGEKILYLEGEPRYEFAFLRRAMRGDSAIQLVSLERTAKGKFYRAGLDDSLDLISGFPTTAEELYRYRALVLGSIEATFFTADQLRLLADFVSERGGTVVFLGGPDALAEGGYIGTAIEPLIPVSLASSSYVPGQATGLKVHLTAPGRLHPVLQLVPGQAANQQLWSKLPPVTTVNALGALRPGATMLLGATPVQGGPERPVLVHQPFGRGMTVLLGVQDTWLWKMNPNTPLEDLSFETFWRQLLRWSLDPVPPRVQVTVTPERIGPGESVTLRARVTDSLYHPVNTAQVRIQVTAPDGSTQEVPLSWDLREDGSYQAAYVGEQAGQYSLVAHVRQGTDSATWAGTTLLVDATGADMERAERRDALLERIARETGGATFDIGALGELPAELRLSKAGITRKDAQDLWDMPIILLLFCGLVAAEWGYRRYRGLA